MGPCETQHDFPSSRLQRGTAELDRRGVTVGDGIELEEQTMAQLLSLSDAENFSPTALPRLRNPVLSHSHRPVLSAAPHSEQRTALRVACRCNFFISLIMVLGRLAHYALDAILLSTVVAGVKRSTGFVYAFPLSRPTPRSHLRLFCTVPTQNPSPIQPSGR
jgi:hypothetical protein